MFLGALALIKTKERDHLKEKEVLKIKLSRGRYQNNYFYIICKKHENEENYQ